MNLLKNRLQVKLTNGLKSFDLSRCLQIIPSQKKDCGHTKTNWNEYPHICHCNGENYCEATQRHLGKVCVGVT